MKYRALRSQCSRLRVGWLCLCVGFLWAYLGVNAWGAMKITTTLTSSTVLVVPRPEKRPTSGVLVVRNESPTTTVKVRISSSSVPDLSSYERILAEVRRRAGNNRSTHTLARAAYNLISEFRPYNWSSADINGECDDPVKLLNVYGYGLCDNAARALATIWHGLGIPAQVWDLRCHVVPEYFVGKESFALDPDMRVHGYIAGTSLTIPARAYHSLRKNLQPAEIEDPVEALIRSQRLMAALDRISTPPRVAFWKPQAKHDAAPSLRPGEVMIRYQNSDLGYYARINPEPPPAYSNAVFVWQRRLPPEVPTDDDVDAVTIRSRLPYVLLGGWIDLMPDSVWEIPPTVEVSCENQKRVPCLFAGALSTTSTPAYRYALPPEIQGAYEIQVHITPQAIHADTLPEMHYKQVLITQCSPTTFPMLSPGDGEEDLYVELDSEGVVTVSLTVSTEDELVDDAVVLKDDENAPEL